MTFRPAYDIPLSYGGDTVWLRPSLLAATRLEALHNGFPALLTKVQQHDTATISELITYSATDRTAAHHLMRSMRGKPLRELQDAILGPALALIAAFMSPFPDEDKPDTKPVTSMPWGDVFADLFKLATGWLAWPPEAAWNATMPEILQAFEGHMDRVKTMSGSTTEIFESGPEDAQRQANIDAGLDPEFDRAGLQGLKGKGRF